ncbi:MAG: methyltransferase domain-containing protein [Bacteroidetes bacterium]|jgi:predicted O-methyltransferase YrrM|nr:methyltransferase domain-containing protein [Bacteroidota bacterium]
MVTLEQYIFDHTDAESDLLAELNRQTHLKILQPRMLSGHLQGRLLSMISRMIAPTNILEIGTYTGYSALCLAEGLYKQGRLHTFEINDELIDFAQSFFSRSKYKDQIVQHVGDAIKMIPEMTKTFDLVFIDGDKKQYLQYFEVVFPVLNSGGFMLIDNTLWSGKVLRDIEEDDPSTQMIIDFNNYIRNHPGLSTVLLPLRDGLTLVQKL